MAALIASGRAMLSDGRNALDVVTGMVADLGGEGGLIAVDRAGNIVMPYNSKGMKRTAVSDSMEPVVLVFEDP